MFPFPQDVNPAVRSHLDAQVAYLNALNASILGSFQKAVQLNMQLTQSILQDTTEAAQRLVPSSRPGDALGNLASSAQPIAEKLRLYQQQIARLAADTQVELTRVSQEHVQETARTAQALGDEVKRVAVEETTRSAQQQEDTLKKLRERQQAPVHADDERSAAQAGKTDLTADEQSAKQKPVSLMDGSA